MTTGEPGMRRREWLEVLGLAAAPVLVLVALRPSELDAAMRWVAMLFGGK